MTFAERLTVGVLLAAALGCARSRSDLRAPVLNVWAAARRGVLDEWELQPRELLAAPTPSGIAGSRHWGLTPLHLACEAGHLDVARWLIQTGADVNAYSPFGYTVMDYARQQGQLPGSPLQELLVEHGARSNVFQA